MSDADQPSTVRFEPWLYAPVEPSDWSALPVDSAGKWCIFADAKTIDSAWGRVRAAVRSNRLQCAKSSTALGALFHRGEYVICVYCPDSHDRDAVMRAREILRDLGFSEELGYKTNQATRAGVYGTPDEWMYRL